MYINREVSACEARVPGTWCLLKSVNCFVKFAQVIRELRMKKTLWLSHIDHFGNFTVKKSILHVKLKDWPTTSDGDGNNQLNCLGLDHRTVSFIVVDAKLLCEPLSHESCPITLNTAISPSL